MTPNLAGRLTATSISDLQRLLGVVSVSSWYDEVQPLNRLNLMCEVCIECKPSNEFMISRESPVSTLLQYPMRGVPEICGKLDEVPRLQIFTMKLKYGSFIHGSSMKWLPQCQSLLGINR